jgi:hypothetical protein
MAAGLRQIFLGAATIASSLAATAAFAAPPSKAEALWALVRELICPLLSGPESLLFWIMKEFGNGQEAQAGRDYRQAA